MLNVYNIAPDISSPRDAIYFDKSMETTLYITLHKNT